MIKAGNKELLKVAFIDDEKLVRKLLMNCVDWPSLGYFVAGESAGGQQALDMICNVKPDLIFVDICMPIISGIEMSSKIIQMLPESRIVIVTGHQEFEYARDSIKIGVFDYLLKPINPNEISETALRVKDEIDIERAQNKQVEELKHRLEDNYPLLRDQYLLQLVEGEIEDAPDSLDYFGIVFEDTFCQVSVIAIEIKCPASDPRFAEITNVLLKSFRMYERIYYFCSGSYGIVISNNRNADLYKILQSIRNELSIRYVCVISAGISNLFDSIAAIPDAYIQAKESMNYKVVCGKGHIVKYSDILIDDRGSVAPGEQIELLKFYMRSGLVNNAENMVMKVLDELMAEYQPRPELLHAAGAKVLSACLFVMMECNISESEVFGRTGNIYEKIFCIETLPQMKRYLKQCVCDIANKAFEMNKSSAHGVVKNIRKFIEENISNQDLSLSGVASIFYLNPSYLSRIYKQETGTTFIEDINKFRIDKVAQMLNENDMKVYELCEKVGIEDAHYLSILFKKYTGMTISDYKHMLKTQSVNNEQGGYYE